MPDTRQQSEMTELQAWQVRALNALLGALALVATPAVIATVTEAIRYPERGALTPVFGVLYLLLLLLAFLRRLSHRVRLAGLLALGYGVAGVALARGGLIGDGRLFLLVLPLLAMALSDLRMGLIASAVSLGVHLVFALLAHMGWLSRWIVVWENPMAIMDWLNATATFVMLLAGLLVLVGFSNRATFQALRSARQSAQEAMRAYDLLEGQTREVERRARWLEVATRIARESGALTEPDLLLSRAAEEMVQRLDVEEVIFYIASPRGELAAQAMAERRLAGREKVPLGISVFVREAFQEGRIRSGWVGGLYEVAVPLRIQERGLGVMAVRFPTEVRSEGPEVVVLELVADQLAVALENARLFVETQTSLRELEALYRRYTTRAWERFVREAPESARLWTGSEEVPEGVWRGLFENARASGSAVTGQENSRYLLAVPVKLRGVTIGVLGFHRDQESGPWRAEEVRIAEMVAERLALAVENARLLEEAQRRAAREHLAAEITARIRASLNPDTVLKTTVRELGRALQASWVAVEVTGPESATKAGLSPEVEG